MFRYVLLAFLATAFLLGSPSPHVSAQWRRSYDRDEISGRYVNRSNGGECSIRRSGRSYIFVNENGTEARFVFDGPNRLRMVDGGWDARTRATIKGRNRAGQMVIRFDSTGLPGFWVQEN